MHITVLDSNLKDISGKLLMPNGKIKLLAAKEYQKYNWHAFRLFCHQQARYGIPTIELVEYIKNIIGEREAIEIGAGAGDLGYHLNIKMTDSYQQDHPAIRQMYEDMGQPTINYPSDVICIDALTAVQKYKPKVVVASWITPYAAIQTNFGSNPMGVKEDKILDLIETFIIIGNMDIHWDKPITKYIHEVFYKDWIVSRAKDPSKNCIMIWNK